MNKAGAAASELQAHLPDCLEKRQRLDVTHRSANLDDGNIRTFGTLADTGLDLIGDVRDHLHRTAEVLAATLFLDHRLIDLTGGEVIHPPHLGRDKTLIVAEVEIGFRPVLGNEHFTMLKRRHRPRIYVDVGVELEVGNADAPSLEYGTQGRCSDPLAKRGHHATRYEHILSHLKPG